jgi:hypothetical protein
MGDGTIILVLDIPGLIEIASSKDIFDYKNLSMAEMKRINSLRSLDTNDSENILKTSHATNNFNAKLHEMRSKDKSKSKRERFKHSQQEAKSRQLASSELVSNNITSIENSTNANSERMSIENSKYESDLKGIKYCLCGKKDSFGG